MQLRDPGLLISLVGLPPRKLNSALTRQLDVFSTATSNEGLLCIRKYWDSHCSTITKLPAIALLDHNSYPRGLSDLDFLQLLSRLTDLQQWQIWDLWDTLDVNSCGYVGCPEFTLVVVLMCAAMSQQQMQAVHAYHSSIGRIFTGAHVYSPLAGLSQCCQLLNLPYACLITALQQLQLKLYSVQPSNSKQGKISSCSCCTGSNKGVNMPASADCKTHVQEASCVAQVIAVSSSSSSSSQQGCCCHSKQPGTGLIAINSQNPECIADWKGSSSEAGPVTGKGSSLCLCTTAAEGAICSCSCNSRHRTVSNEDLQLLLYGTIQQAQLQEVDCNVNAACSSSDADILCNFSRNSSSIGRGSSCMLMKLGRPTPCCTGCIIS